jgi:hypothetical protein
LPELSIAEKDKWMSSIIARITTLCFAAGAALLLTAGPAHATFSWANCGPASAPFQVTSISVGSDPTPPSGLPARYEVIYDLITNKILNVFWSFGLPYGAPVSPGSFRLQIPTGGAIGSATYTPPSLSIPAGTYSVSSNGLRMALSVSRTINPATVSVTLEEKVLGVYVEIPNVSIGDTWTGNPSWATDGDYLMQFTLNDVTGSLGCVKMEFSTIGGGPVVAYGVYDTQQEIQTLAASVQALGAQLPANGQPLLAKLNAALGDLASGDPQDAAGALGAFVNEVQALIGTGGLTSQQGQPLISLAQAIAARLG